MGRLLWQRHTAHYGTGMDVYLITGYVNSQIGATLTYTYFPLLFPGSGSRCRYFIVHRVVFKHDFIIYNKDRTRKLLKIYRGLNIIFKEQPLFRIEKS